MSIDDVPKDCKLYFWDGQLWLRWEDLDDLPGSEHDPLRIKVVRLQLAGEMFSFTPARILHGPIWNPRRRKNYNCFDKGCLNGGALHDARVAHVFSAASCCKGFDVFPGLWPSVPCVCSLMDLVIALDMLHTT